MNLYAGDNAMNEDTIGNTFLLWVFFRNLKLFIIYLKCVTGKIDITI